MGSGRNFRGEAVGHREEFDRMITPRRRARTIIQLTLDALKNVIGGQRAFRGHKA